jgi:predicted metal-binding protein
MKEGEGMSDREVLERVFAAHGVADFRWMDPKEIVVSQWVRMKCEFGCGGYGQNATCPPNTPSVDACREFFEEYSEAAIIRFEKVVDRPEDRHAWTRGVNKGLVELEREVFLSGYEKAFLLFMDTCELCSECTGVRVECKVPRSARPTPEAMAVDVFATVRKVGYPIEVLAEYTEAMNRYAFLMVE